MPASPNVLNYYIGKGKLSFKPDGGSFRDVGNVPTFEFTPAITKLDHFSSRQGVKNKDRSVITEKTATVHIVMDEWTPENMALAFLGTVTQDTDGQALIAIFGSSSIKGELKFIGTNDIGPRVEMLLPNVEFIPGQNINMIADAFGQLDLVGDVTADQNGSFGTIKHLADEGGTEFSTAI